MKYLDVVVENKSRHTDSFFTYRAPDETELRIGDKVWVPFGRGDKTKAGFVFAFPEHISCPEQKIKEIEGVDAAGSLNREMMKTAAWMKQRYAITYSDAISCFCVKGKPPREGKAKEPYKDLPGRDERPAALTEEQTASVERINEAIAASRHEIFLLHGVTASGKTEVYMEAIDKCLKLDKTAIMLVPEIALTNQIMEHFIGRFGKDRLAVMHSKLTPRERYDEWHRIRSGRARIVIGARMGVFAPAENIGLIIMDEEHEATYKSDMTPKYDTVEVAAKRLQTTGGVLLLGSATPSVVSYERAKEGIYQLLTLKQRYNRNPLPKVEIVDMREELRAGNTNIFSRRLYTAIEETLKKGQQVILFQNRRGYSSFVSCRACGAANVRPSGARKADGLSSIRPSLLFVKLPQTHDLRDRKREADRPRLRLRAGFARDGAHDLRLLRAGGDDVDHVLFLRKRDTEEFRRAAVGGALRVQDRSAACACRARGVHHGVGIALIENDDDQLVFKLHYRYSSLRGFSAGQRSKRARAADALDRDSHHDPVAGDVDVQLLLGKTHQPAHILRASHGRDDRLCAAL